MSGLGGLISVSGADVYGDSEVCLASSLRRRGHHPSGHRVDGGPRFLHAALRPARPAHPELWYEGPICVAWDGRLDNRADLDRALGQTCQHDLERVHRVYERWGVGGFTRVVGDFALALWDGRRRRLILARDPMGVRPLFYMLREGLLTWGSTLQSVASSRTGANIELDENWVAGFLAYAIDPDVTAYRSIQAVPPGHAVVLDSGALRVEQFWAPEVTQLPELADDRAYEERFSELFMEAVRCRIDEHAPIGAELSGGLDSSSIACVTVALIHDGRASAPDLFTLSHVYGRSPTSDERRFIGLVEAQIGKSGVHVEDTEAPLFAGLEDLTYEAPTVLQCAKARYQRISEAMHARGSSVLLSGFAGDQVLQGQWSGTVLLADMAWSGRFGRFARSLKDWHTANGIPYPALVAGSLTEAFWPGRRRRAVLRNSASILNAVDPAFARRTQLAERLASPAIVEATLPPSKRLHVAAIRSAVQAVSWLYEYGSGPWPYEVAYPFLHRPLVEFCLATPGNQLMRPRETRSLHRRALRPWLPPGIAQRRDKQGPSEAMARELASSWAQIKPLLEDMQVFRRGIIDRAGFHRAVEETRSGRAFSNLPIILRTMALEVWLRGHQRGARDQAPLGFTVG
jgi:asparagine synthase (glutamine-hydrolysing)